MESWVQDGVKECCSTIPEHFRGADRLNKSDARLPYRVHRPRSRRRTGIQSSLNHLVRKGSETGLTATADR